MLGEFVICRSRDQGVVCGYLKTLVPNGELFTAELTEARQIRFWSDGANTLFEMALTGPGQARISLPINLFMATAAIAREIRLGVVSARRSASQAAAALDDADEPLAAELRYNRQTRQIVRRVNQLLKDMREVAGKFGIDVSTIAASADTQVVQIKAGMRERARLYSEAIAEVRRLIGDEADPMARALERDGVPALIAADYIEDHGGDASALRAAFEGE